MKTIRDIDVKDKTILVRVDYNVPIKNNKIESNFRIRASLPTLEYLRKHGAKKIILLSHLGRPEKPDKSLSLKPVADHLNHLIGNVFFAPDLSKSALASAVDKLQNGQILLAENLRFNPGETANSADFINSIVEATKADFYVQDAFSVTHRAHASTVKIADFLPVYAGLLLEKELANLDKATKNPSRPFLLIIGGSKVEDKSPLITKFVELADHVAVGGKIAADGYTSNNSKIYVATDFDEDSTGKKLDIGPVSTAKIADLVTDANTIIWNGLLGYAEDPAYATASTIIAELLGEKKDATTIICGGDTTGFILELMNEHEHLDYTLISTGGGATLEYLLSGTLPGLEVIAS